MKFGRLNAEVTCEGHLSDRSGPQNPLSNSQRHFNDDWCDRRCIEKLGAKKVDKARAYLRKRRIEEGGIAGEMAILSGLRQICADPKFGRRAFKCLESGEAEEEHWDPARIYGGFIRFSEELVLPMGGNRNQRCENSIKTTRVVLSSK
ncbi:unnamed protein product [Schistocephalus solidus]|uniref:DUF5069 domain-containing protein n=1 Tax=Schistocephalus solidus TaxID=70667 RepID=A0A183SZW8_SCHSO|nr:unnamed protein product [Schistocephalus solidus]